MTTIREPYPIHESAKRRFDLNVSVEINISSREARRQCNIWLGEEVAMGFIAHDIPNLLVREDGRVVWRSIIRFVVSRVGVLGILGYVDVDVSTREILCTDEQVSEFFALAEKMADNMPPSRPKRPLPPEFRPPAHLKAPMGKRIP